MGRKRKAHRGAAAPPKGPRELDPADGRLGPIKTYKDLADPSEDEFSTMQDHIMFDGDEDEDDEDDHGKHRKSKRQRQLEEDQASLELSDEEILGYDDEDEGDGVDDTPRTKKTGNKAKKTTEAAGGDGENEADLAEREKDADDGDEGWWGSIRGEYYDADKIETEVDALEEEAEAKRLQAKKLSKMDEADFVFDEVEWAAIPAAEPPQGGATVTEVLDEIEVPSDMTAEDRYELLRARYPEFDYLVQEFNSLQPLIQQMQRAAGQADGASVEAVRYWVLGCYVAALASYFAILTSPARDGSGEAKTLNPSNLRDHEVMETLVSCRKAWMRVRDIRSTAGPKPLRAPSSSDELAATMNPAEGAIETSQAPARTEKDKAKAKRAKAKAKAKAAMAKKAEAAVADLSDLVTAVRAKKTKSTNINQANNLSDFGEEEALDADEAAAKAARKNSLRFYTSQIVQKGNKRADAGREAGGDTDIPYRESLWTRQAKTSERRQRQAAERHADDRAAPPKADSDEEYYHAVAAASKQKKEAKESRKEALATAGALDRVVEMEEVGDDGKRRITYAIQKNKGLAPHRKKEVRNPRVRYKNKVDRMHKKLVSRRGALHKTEERGGYAGERTGINTSVVRSVKL